MSVAKIVELVGSSDKSWEDAVNEAIKRASRTIRNIRGVDVIGQKAVVKDGKIIEYRVNVKISFGVE
ncbi:MAG: dodecin family protein [Candidatus Aenigmatarchaeota archaeon]